MTSAVDLHCLTTFASHLRKAAVRFVTSFRREQPGHHWKDFCGILYLEIYKKNLKDQIKVLVKSDNSNMICIKIYVNLL
jgi:hypothetical protein